MAKRKLYCVFYETNSGEEQHFAYVYAKNTELAKEIVRKLTSTRLEVTNVYGVDEIDCGVVAFFDGHFYEGMNF